MAMRKNFLGDFIIKLIISHLSLVGIGISWAYDSRAEYLTKYQNTLDDYCSYARGDDDLDQMNFHLLKLNRINADLNWKLAIEPSKDVYTAKIEFHIFKSLWSAHWCNKLTTNHQHRNAFIQCNNRSRMIHLLCNRGPKYSPYELKNLSRISDRLLLNYGMKTICLIHIDNYTLAGQENKDQCYRGEHDVKELLQISRDESERQWAWTSWRNDMGRLKNLFTASMVIQNSGARRNGYADMGDCWREEIDVPNIEDLSDNLWQSIKPLYELLHAVLRFHLRKLYPNAILRPTAPIPAHLIGDLWPNDWQSLINILFPKYYINITDVLVEKNYTVEKMVKDSKDFFTSLNFPQIRGKFWIKSIGSKRNNSTPHCHGAAINMFRRNDFRILGCFKVDDQSFRIIHHEMGHVQYYMAYESQPTIYQNGVNSAFHESIGDAIFLGVMTPQHLQRLGFISNNTDDSISILSLALLLKQAMSKIPQVPFALIMDKWRWRIFEGIVNEDEYNKTWWVLHRSMMGIVPSHTRHSASYFDAAKYHIISSTPYIRYFFGTILQFQIFETMCGIVTSDNNRKYHENLNFPLHECDIYGGHTAGNELRKLMSMGSSISTHQAFSQFLNTTGYRTDSFLKYFQPLKRFLEWQIHRDNIPVGWR